MTDEAAWTSPNAGLIHLGPDGGLVPISLGASNKRQALEALEELSPEQRVNVRYIVTFEAITFTQS